DEGQRENVYTGFIDNVVEAEESLARDLDSKNIIDRAQEVRDIETLAQYWVSGAKIEWADFGGFFDKSIITVSLPTYPFLRKRYWVDVVGNGVKSSDTELSTRARASGDTPVLHPLIHENISSFAKQCFRSKFTGEEFFFTDHIVGGSPILPGSAYIEMVRYCLDNSLQECEKLSFENIVFKEPLRSTCLKELDVHTTLFADLENENAFSFEVVSIAFDEPTRVHAQGQVLVGGQFIHSDPQPLDLKAIKSRCNDVKESTEVYAKFSEMGFSYGPKFSVINAIYFNDSEALAKLALADVIDSLDDVFTIHPGMLDGALQSLVPLLADSTIYVPFNIGKLTVTHKIPKRVYAYAKMQTHTTEKSPQFLSFDVTLCDDNGRVLLSVKDIVYRALKGEKNTNADDSYHQHDIHLVCPKWQPKTQLETNQTLNAPILVVANSPSHIDALVEQIKSKHDCPIIAIIASADAHPKHSLHFDLVDMSSKHGLVSLLSKMKFENRFPGTVIVGFSSDTESMKYTSEVSDLLDCVCQSLSAVGIPKPLNIVSYYGYSSGVPAPRFSAISAYLKVFQSEHANVRYKTLAIHSGRNSLQLVTEELNANSVSEQLRFPETGDRQLMSYHPISLDVSAELNSPKSILRTRGVYLITGGAGGIGESLAYYLCREYSAKVLLIGRSDICESKKALIQNLKAIGGDAQYFKCDINRIEDIYAVLAITDDQFGQINGVMHCAGVAGTSLIKNKQKSISTEILKPKTIGLENLDLATKDVELDFFTQFSSTSALFGDGGLSDYAYANAYMDAFSELRQKAVVEGLRHGKSISINWPYWLSGGMQVEKHVENVMLDLYGLQSIGKNEALSLFEKITKLNINNLAVLPGNKEKILGVLNALDTRVQAGVEHVPSDRKALSASKTGLNRHISSVLIEMVQNILKLDKEDVSISEELKNYGFESVSFAQFSSQINAKWGLSINPTVFFECHTLTALAHYLSESFGQKFENTDDLDRQLHTIAAGNEISKLSEQVEDTTFIGAGGPHQASKSEAVDDPVVIVGMSGIMPQSRNLNEFWESLIQGRSLISEVPGARWNWKDYYGDAINNPSKTNSKWGGFIDDVDAFDPAFFNLSVTEAEVMDPQHRLFLQEAWRCIEDAGYAPSSLSGAKVAVYVGMQFQEYQALMQRHSGSMTAHMATGNAHSILPNRVSYLLNLRGPSEAIDTACSSSLVAIHRAVNSLLSGEVDAAIAGGVSLALSPETFVLTSQMGAFSADGQCKTFDKSANGYVKGEGVGAVYLKRMSVAKKDGDQIYAVIKSSAVNHGGKSQSLTAPNSDAQAELLVDAYRKAEVDPRSIDFIETHGTGTELGDPIEVQGLKRAFDILFKDRPISDAGDAKIALGAVKTNTGHLEPAAGMAGLFKILLSMKHGLIPKNINFTEQNPFIELDDSPFYILNQVKNWPVRIDRHGEKIPRRAGLSSFGFGGVNAHLVVEDFAAKAEENLADHSSDTSEKLILLSAKTETALEAMVNDLHIFVTDEKNSINLNALAYTLQCGRENMTCRLCVHVTSVDQLIESLKALSVDLSNSNRSRYTSLNDRDISGGDLVAAVGKCSSDLARLWLEGANIDWQTLYRSPYPTRLHLPTYRFDLNRYWFKEINEKHPLKSFDAPLDALSKNTNLAFSGARHRVRPSKPALNRFSLVSPQWKKFSAVSSLTRAGIPSKIETIFIFSDDAAFARMIEESRPGLRVVLFHSHPLLQNTVSQAFEVSDYSNRNQIDQAFAAIIASNIYPDMVVVDIPSVKWDEKIVENKSIHTVVIQAVYICQNISRYLHSNSIDLFFINAHESMASQPQISALSGFIKCFRLEDDRIKTCLIEVVFDNSEKYSAKKTEFLSLEASISDADEVKYFENARWLVSQKKIDVTHEAARLSGNKSIFTENGVYLLSGGAGGLGQIFSEHIASGLQNVTIVMLGRNTPDKSLLTQLQKNNPGSRVEFVQADVSKLSEVRFSVRNIEQKFGRINGVIHCAGVLSDKLVKNKNAHHIDTVVQPKIYGALNLDEATQHCDLDFMMYCSSLSALVGNAGQSVYAYSNRFLDIFAQYRNDLVSRGLRKGNTQSINWPLWKDGGMSIDDSILNDIENFRGFLPISRVEGIRIFDTMIVSGLESAYPFIERAHDFPNENENSPYMPESRAELGEGPEHNAGKVQTNSAPMATVVDVEITPNVEDNIPKVIDYLQQKISLIVKSDVAIDAAFEASGIDSFLSIKLLNELENDIGRLRKTLLFEFFTIEMLSKYLIDNHYLRLSGMLDFSVFKRLHPRELDKPKVVETLGVAVAATLPNSSESGNQVVDTHLFDKALGLVVSIFSEALKAKISEEDTFTDAGVDSFLSINVLRKLEDIFGTLRKTLLFEFFTPKTLTRYFVDHHLDVIEGHFLNLKSEFEKIGERAGVAEQSVERGCILLREQELEADPELRSVYIELINRKSNEGIVARAASLITPYVFIGASRSAIFRVNIHAGNLLAWPYVGPESEFELLTGELTEFAEKNSLEPHILSTTALNSVNSIQFTSTPFGAIQQIVGLDSFHLTGKPMRKLRYAVNKFAQAGELNFVEYRIGTERTTDLDVVNMIDQWCEIKTQINPCVTALKRDIESGSISDEHRVFLTYLNSSLANVILITKMSTGYLMDMEFYPKGSTYGSLEYSICQIIERLNSEGCPMFSLGGTYGPEIITSPNADEGMRSILNHLRETGDFSQGNLQFKNKFRTRNTPIYVCKPVGGDPSKILDILMLIADPSDSGPGNNGPDGDGSVGGSKPLLRTTDGPDNVKVLSGKSIAAGAEAETDARATLLEKNGYNPALVAPESIDYDLFTDSWLQLKTDYVAMRVKHLNCNTVDDAVDIDAQLKKVFAFEYVLAVPSGRKAETILYKSWPSEKKQIVQNLLFPTGIFTQLDEGFQPVEFPFPQVLSLRSSENFRGGLDSESVDLYLQEHADKAAMLCVELANNASGGYPVSIDNLEVIKSLSQRYGIPLVLDVTRILDNAIFIQRSDDTYKNMSLWDITHKICSFADCITGSLGKNFCVPVGGFVAVRDSALFDKVKKHAQSSDYLLSVEQQKIVTRGLQDIAYIEQQVVARVDAVRSVWVALKNIDMPVMSPAGGHCVLIDVSQIPAFFKNSEPQSSFIAWLYRETGVRAGIHNAGMKKNTVLNRMVRLAVPVGLPRKSLVEFTETLVSCLAQCRKPFDLELVEKPVDSYGHMRSRFKRVSNYSSVTETQNSTQANIKESLTPLYADDNASDKTVHSEDVAIVGLAGRYPMAGGIEEFWENLKAGRDCISEIPSERLELIFQARSDQPLWGGYVDGIDKFDAEFFNIHPRDAKHIDPQERLFLETAWHALEDAGYYPESLIDTLGTNKIGVYAGVVWSQYHMLALDNNFTSQLSTQFGVANRVSYFMNFSGPSLTLNSACTSSLNAFKLACDAISSKQIQAAIVGGVNLDIHASKQHALSAGKSLSSSGRCRSFGKGADGYVTGEGVGAIVLKPLSQAIRDNDNVYAVIKSIASSHTGASSGYGIPNPSAQTEIIAEALKNAKVTANSISYIEAHGTGTELGDSIEVLGLSNALNQNKEHKNQWCSIGSVKSSIGHLEAAAGIAGITKVALQFRHKQLVPSLHSAETNELIEFKESPLYVQQENSAWETNAVKTPLRAGLNAFADGGSNVHVIFEEYHSKEKNRVDESRAHIFPLSANSQASLEKYVFKLAEFLRTSDTPNVCDIAYTLQLGRKPMRVRAAFSATSVEELVSMLERYDGSKQSFDTAIGPSKSDCCNGDIQSYLLSGNSEKLIEAWLGGARLNWKNIYKDARPSRISLPNYPFVRQSHWLDSVVEQNNVGHSLRNADYIPPKTGVEEKLANIWEEVLGIGKGKLGAMDSFFEVGGDSLSAVTVISKIRQEFDRDFPMTSLFAHPTVRASAEALEALPNATFIPAIKQIGKVSCIPQSFAQKSLWLIDQINGPDDSYNIGISTKLSGELDVDSLTNAFAQIIQGNDVFRTTFTLVSGTPVQLIADKIEFSLPVVAVDEDLVDGYVASHFKEVFDLVETPLISVKVFRVAPDQHVLSINIHHIIFDAWSLGLLCGDINRLYRGELLENRSALQYKDYSVWQQHVLTPKGRTSKWLDSMLDYWEEYLKDGNYNMALPYDSDEIPENVKGIGAVQRSIDEQFTLSLRMFAVKNNATLFTTFFSTLSILMSRWCNCDDVILGTVVAGRNSIESESMFGCFMNFLALRARVDQNLTIEQFVKSLSTSLLESLSNQECPFEKIVERINPKTRSSRSPLYNVSFRLQNMQIERLELPGLIADDMSVTMGGAQLDLMFEVIEKESALILQVQYDKALFHEETITTLLTSFEFLLKQLPGSGGVLL
ncbi:MAG: acyl transferase domain-containing protein/tryptophanase/acyl carrier protein, partial [Lentisphaeria bacterium]